MAGRRSSGEREFEQVTAKQARGKEQDFQILDLARAGVQPRDHVVAQFFGLLLGVGRTFIDVQDVRFAVLFEGQFRFHSTVPGLLLFGPVVYLLGVFNRELGTAPPVALGFTVALLSFLLAPFISALTLGRLGTRTVPALLLAATVVLGAGVG